MRARRGAAHDGASHAWVRRLPQECRADPQKRTTFLKTIFQLLNSPSPAIMYEAASTLVSLSAAATAVRAAVQTYTSLLMSQSDNNVKLIVLERLAALRRHHPKVMQEALMDLLRSLQSPSLDVRQKVLDITLGLVTPRNIDELVGLLKKEVLRTQEGPMDNAAEYRSMLVKVRGSGRGRVVTCPNAREPERPRLSWSVTATRLRAAA